MASKPVWIWKEDKRPAQNEVCFFRKSFIIEAIPAFCRVRVSADTYYILYVNGSLVSRGPAKGDRYRKYYDVLDLTPYLKTGENIIAAKVAYFSNDNMEALRFEAGPISRISSSRGGFLLKEETTNFGISTGADWKVYSGQGVIFVNSEQAKYAGAMERVDMNDYPRDFIALNYNDASWQFAVEVADIDYQIAYGIMNQWVLEKNPLPPQYEKVIFPKRIMRFGGLEDWNRLLEQRGEMELPPGGPYWVELDMGQLTTAYVGIRIKSCSKTQVSLSYAESYFKLGQDSYPVKQVRDDLNGSLFIGETDSIITAPGNNYYETMFFRTFRFLRLEIARSESAVKIDKLSFMETGYPLKVIGKWHIDLPIWQKLWDISVTTLQRCMHETYEDCPYYEQMQYTMDTFLQTIYTYQISSDDRLARKAIYDFHSSLLPNGLLTCNAPSKFIQIIPGFNLFWIDMLYHHYVYFGDIEFMRRFLPTVDAVLGYFIRKIDPEDGLIHDVEYWQFVDWVDEWRQNAGAPIYPNESVNVIYNMMVVYALGRAAYLNNVVGRRDTANEYKKMMGKISHSIRKHCWNPNMRMFMDTVGREAFSQHGQVWAVLSSVIEGEEAKELMKRCIENTSLPKCSYSMSFYLFRALEKVGLYHVTKELWKTWEKLLELNITTWPEDPVSQRSDCHAWSSLPLYEFSACILGVRPEGPGYSEIRIAPFTDFLEKAEGSVATLHGPVHVKWEKVGGKIQLEVKLPTELRTIIKVNDKDIIYEGVKLIQETF